MTILTRSEERELDTKSQKAENGKSIISPNYILNYDIKKNKTDTDREKTDTLGDFQRKELIYSLNDYIKHITKELYYHNKSTTKRIIRTAIKIVKKTDKKAGNQSKRL